MALQEKNPKSLVCVLVHLTLVGSLGRWKEY